MNHSERMGAWLRLYPHGFIFDSRRKGGYRASFCRSTWFDLSFADRSYLKANLLVRLPGLMQADLNCHLPVQPS